MVWGWEFVELVRMAVSRTLRRVSWSSRRDLALSMGKPLGGFTLEWKNWEVG